ncbi:MAG: hypothetical protein A2287_02860 [Candidatus Melainabacteria bacterium RIFOXYA12_FULL_32_12]|nr:MAG: hypothetical protein A2255_08305 [Candidatus Melainabacteria bacterium RIFOXYA2_FULL_32_9]OGI29324.1 MAG: hypothetical protein A2287_02860 [Candidatus Melainabacteria bacterium RIFOXYA12_FULL_32_12]
MNFKKLSLAAAISISVLTAGNAAKAQVGEIETTPTVTTQTSPVVQAPVAVDEVTPTAVGVGPAGTFKAFGTTEPYGGNAAGSTEISTFQSPQTTAIPAALAAQGIYGQCPPCQTAVPTGGAAVIPVSPTIEPSQILIRPETVATPQTSNLTGGAAAAEAMGLECEVLPIVPQVPVTGGAAIVPTMPVTPADPVCPTMVPVTPLGPVTTGGAATVCPVPCVPGATIGERSAMAPEGFEQPEVQITPGAITGGAAVIPATPAIPACPVCPNTIIQVPTPTGGAAVVVPQAPVGMQQPMMQQPMMQQPMMQQPMMQQPMMQQQMMMQQGVCPTTTPVRVPLQTSVMTPTTISMCPTGAAAQVTPFTATCPGSIGKTEYIERQVYAYPALPDMNEYVSGAGNIIELGGINDRVSVINPPALAFGTSPISSNITGAASPLIPSTTITTGSVNPFGCGGNIQQIRTGTPISLMPGQAPITGPITMQTATALQFSRTVMIPTAITGAAAPEVTFADIPQGFWASDEISRLATAGVITGYPDRTFRPTLPVSRAEFATMLVSGLNLQDTPARPEQIFRDVPQGHWANPAIDKVYNRGLVAGYPNDTYRPSEPVSRTEALNTLAMALPTTVTGTEADQILNQYRDGDEIPSWARISVAKALKAGALQGTPTPNQINPNQNATRAEIAAMLSNVRQTLALEQSIQPIVTGAAATLQQEIITAPVLNVKFNDNISARTGHIGDTFTATTLEPVTINNVAFPAGSTVGGRVVEVIRPGGANGDGALKVAFSGITSGGQTAALPTEVLTAQVQAADTPAWRDALTRVVEFPFVWPGRLLGTVGRTLGSMTIIAGNSTEQILGGIGTAGGELVNGEFGAAGRSALGSGVELVRTPFDLTRVALSGATGILGVSADEIGYLVGAGGSRIAKINSDDRVSIAFGCQ